MKRLIYVSAIVWLFTQVSLAQADAAKCQSQCVMPDVYKTETEQIMVKAATTRTELVPARYETVTEKVIVKEAASRLEAVPAVYETMTERVLSKQGTPSMRVIPAKYETVTERILVREASSRLEIIPARYETVTEKRLVKEASTRLEVIPARYETVTEQKLVAEASSRLEIIPARYETITEKVLVKEAASRLEAVPAIYETVTEQKLISEAGSRIEKIPAKYELKSETKEIAPATIRYEMRKQAGCLSPNPGDCMYRCEIAVPAKYETVQIKVKQGCPDGYTENGEDCIRTIEIPAKYANVSYQKLVTPASSRTIEIPAQYAERSITKLVEPASTRTIDIPAKYASVSYQKLIEPASTRTIEIPAVYQDISYQKLVSPATTKTVEIPAEYTNRTYQKLVSPASTEQIPCGSKPIILENIVFETNSAVLKSSSMVEINQLYEMLKAQPQMSARLLGHTDSDGGDDANQILSENRAKAVYDVLVSKGIEASRLSFEGKGETAPIATNETAAGKQKNRRTELVTSGGEMKGGDCDTYINRSYQKLVTPASTRTIEIPASYADRSYQKLVSAASTRSIEVPAEYKTITKQVLVKKGGFTEFRDVLCESNITPELIGKLYTALKEKGYAVGNSSTTLNATLKSALVKYQKDNGLPVGAVDFDSLKSLGIE
jgi:outer membrane protein OmpA-like peptidoglycan-associated protein